MTVQKERAVFRHGRDRDFTREEFIARRNERDAAKARGDMETYERIKAILPANPHVVKAFKDVYGKDFILSGSYRGRHVFREGMA